MPFPGEINFKCQDQVHVIPPEGFPDYLRQKTPFAMWAARNLAAIITALITPGHYLSKYLLLPFYPFEDQK